MRCCRHSRRVATFSEGLMVHSECIMILIFLVNIPGDFRGHNHEWGRLSPLKPLPSWAYGCFDVFKFFSGIFFFLYNTVFFGQKITHNMFRWMNVFLKYNKTIFQNSYLSLIHIRFSPIFWTCILIYNMRYHDNRQTTSVSRRLWNYFYVRRKDFKGYY